MLLLMILYWESIMNPTTCREAFKKAAGLADYVCPQSDLLSVSSIKSSSPYALEMNQEDAIEIQPLSQPPFTLRLVNIAMENGYLV